MTEVGRMIYEDGRLDGREKGRVEGREEGISIGLTKGKADLLIKQLIKKFKKLPENYKVKILNLSQESLEVLGGDIFDLEKVEDLEQYF